MADNGRLNTLTVKRIGVDGVFLDGGASGDIYLPEKAASGAFNPGDTVDVFVFVNREKNLQATLKKPAVTVGQLAWLPVVATTAAGAFLDWGLQHDLFVPRREQRVSMVKGKSYVVLAFLDERSGRVTASSKLNQFLGLQAPDYSEGVAVDLFICEQTDLGYKVVVDNAHWGILYKNEVFQKLHPGQQLKGYIKSVRADLKIDVRLQPSGYRGVDHVSRGILNALKAQGGRLAVSDKSPPEEIYTLFGISKKKFKQAIGALYKKRLITLDPKGIQLVRK